MTIPIKETNANREDPQFTERLVQASVDGATAAIVLFLRKHKISTGGKPEGLALLVTYILDYVNKEKGNEPAVILAARSAVSAEIVTVRQIYHHGSAKDFTGFVRIIVAAGVVPVLESMKPEIIAKAKEISGV